MRPTSKRGSLAFNVCPSYIYIMAAIWKYRYKCHARSIFCEALVWQVSQMKRVLQKQKHEDAEPDDTAAKSRL